MRFALGCQPVLPFVLLLAACSGPSGEEGTGDKNLPEQSPVAVAASPKSEATIITRDQAGEIYRCRGLMSAAWAATTRLKADEVPEALRTLTMAEVNVWNRKMGSIPPGTLGADEEIELLAENTRVLATTDALEKELASIQSCRAAAR